MLVNVNHNSRSNFFKDLMKYAWKNDNSMVQYFNKKDIEHYETKYKGIYYTHLNPSLTIDPCYSINSCFDHFETNIKVDKRNRKFNLILNTPVTKWYTYSFEELQKMSEFERNLARKPIKNLFHSFSNSVIVDNIEQFYSYFKFLNLLNKEYIACLTPIYKSEQPSTGGWRWHKWGPYLGNQKSIGTEYLYDEPNIDLIFVATVYEVNTLILETKFTEFFNIYLLENSLIFKNKENQLVAIIYNEKKDNISFLGANNVEDGLIYQYSSFYQNHLDQIIKDITNLYVKYLNTGIIQS